MAECGVLRTCWQEEGRLRQPICTPMGGRAVIKHISYEGLSSSKHGLLQVILAMKDAISLPWSAVRSAWVTFMHDLEEGNLQNTQPPQLKKICKYFNEGICSHEYRIMVSTSTMHIL